MDTRTFAYENRLWVGVLQLAFGTFLSITCVIHLAYGRRRLSWVPSNVDTVMLWATIVVALSLIVYGVWLILQQVRLRRSIALTADRLVAPSGFRQENVEIPYRSIRSLKVTKILWQTHLSIRHDRGTLALQDHLLSGRSAFRDFVDTLFVRVGSAAGGR